MVFSSIAFLIYFLPINLVLYYILKTRDQRNAVLIVFSLIFYAWGEPVWISLMIFSAVVDFLCGRWIARQTVPLKRRLGLIVSLASNLGLLGFFKYGGFFVDNINQLFHLSLPFHAFALPIGISFYTFQTLSYTIDVYRGDVEPNTRFFDFLLYVSLFHQLVAGPIVRYRDVAHEIRHREENWSDFSYGVNRFCIGLFKKVYFGNIAGEIGSVMLDGDLTKLSVSAAWLGSACFALQIYYDFSGYSDMAIGLGRMVGFHYRENFNYPYISESISAFWRRWHISLGSFFRDYVYIPLGGNRRRFIRNMAVVWFLTGLWHGASWNFVLWGLFNGVLIFAERWGSQLFRDFSLPALIVQPIKHVYFLAAMLVGWMIFYYPAVSDGFTYIGIMFGYGADGLVEPSTITTIQHHFVFFALAVMGTTPLFEWLWKKLKGHEHLWAETALHFGLLAISLVYLIGQSYNPFLYFRF
ncbi:MAG: alginate O-acetyltransferase complex protein AlgI [Clostridiales bacterium]|jgi:alginate O-acetyltransferase complex protein AlgI|nr:alginate O-acetyltransferase complex protein AlgI [Clostridiales bacterium]MDN5298346.1 alginate O-acetyltransferase complex protein AlgI [Clostridiales bacterium]